MRKIKVVVLLVRQLQHGFTKNAKVSPNLTVTHIGCRTWTCIDGFKSMKLQVSSPILIYFFKNMPI